MTSEEFKTEIMARLPYAHYMTKEEHNMFESDLLTYAKFKAPSQLKEVLEIFKKEEFKRRPGIWWFYKQDKREVASRLWWFKCDACGAQYSRNSRVCPSCGDNITSVVIDKDGRGYTEDVTILHRDCAECKIYKGEGNVRGPLCNMWGKNPKDSVCEDCVCIMCCDYEDRFKKNPRKTSKEAMPWMV